MARTSSTDPNVVTQEIVAAPGQAVDIVSVRKSDGTKVLTVDKDGALRDAAVPVSALGAGQLSLDAMPRAASGVLTAKGAGASPAYETLDIGDVLSGQLTLAQMPRGADGGFLAGKGVTLEPEYRTITLNDIPEGTGVLKGAAGHPTYAALLESDIPNLSAAKITSGNLALARLATGTGILKATGSTPSYGAIELGDLPVGVGFLASSGVAPAYRALLATDIPSLDASKITAGTIDGDRLPAMSASKRGAVPATGTPSGLYLKDDGTWGAPAGGSGSSGGLGNYKFIVYKSGSNYIAATPSGSVASTSASASTVINYALSNLTVGRSWKEKVVLLGDITLDARINLVSYSILEVVGRLYQADHANQQMLRGASLSNIEIYGGEWDGNQLHQDVDGVTVFGSDCCGIDLQSCTDIVIHDLVIHDTPYDNILAHDCQRGLIDRVTSHHAGTYANGPSWYGHGIMCIGSRGFRVCNNHIYDTASGGVYMYTEIDGLAESVDLSSLTNNRIERTMTSGLSISLRGAEDTGRYCMIANNQCIDCGMDGMHPSINLGYSSTNLARNCVVIGNNVSQTGAYDCGEGITLHCDHCVITGNTVFNVNDGGIVLGAGSHNIIAHNNVENVQGLTSYSIYILDASFNDVHGNVLVNSPVGGIFLTPEGGTGPQYNWVHDNLIDGVGSFYVRVAEAASTGNIIENNNCIGAGTIANAGTGTVIRGNRGHVTEASGAATIASGTSSIAVSHGLARTPTKIVVTGSSEDTASLYVTSIGASTFTVYAKDGNVGGDRTVYWRAEY